MKVEVNITKSKFFIILGAILILGVIGVVYAFGGNSPSVVGHNPGEIDWSQAIQSDVIMNENLQVGDNINAGDVFVRVDNEFISRMVTKCDWIGWRSFQASTEAPAALCANNFVVANYYFAWKTGSCSTLHAKGYTCTLNVKNSRGTYDLTCSYVPGGESYHGEWTGTDSNKWIQVSHLGIIGDEAEGLVTAKVDYDVSTGKWTLTSVGKENNNNPPYWSTKTCSAGGFI